MKKLYAVLIYLGLVLLLSGKIHAQDAPVVQITINFQREAFTIIVTKSEDIKDISITFGDVEFEYENADEDDGEDELGGKQLGRDSIAFSDFLWDTLFEDGETLESFTTGKSVICFILETKENEEGAPLDCNSNNLLRNPVNSLNAFWWDDITRNTRTFSVYQRNGTDRTRLTECTGGEAEKTCRNISYTISNAAPQTSNCIRQLEAAVGLIDDAKGVAEEINGSSASSTEVSAEISRLVEQAYNAYERIPRILAENPCAEVSIELFTSIIALQVQYPDLFSPDEKARSYRLRGEAYVSLGEYQAAIDDFTILTTLVDRDEKAYYSLGRVYHLLEDYAQAIANYQQSIDYDDREKYTWYYLGFAQLQFGLAGDAIYSFSQAIEIDPEFIDAYLARARVHYFIAYYPACIADYQSVIDLYEAPGSTLGATPSFVLNNQAVCWDARGLYSRGLQEYTQAYENEPTNVTILLNRGDNLRSLNRFEEAIDVFEELDKLLRIIPDEQADADQQVDSTGNTDVDTRALLNIGVTYRLWGDYERREDLGDGADYYQEAIRVLREALALNPEVNTEIVGGLNGYIELGYVYLALGDFSSARDCIEGTCVDGTLAFRNHDVATQVQHYLALAEVERQKAQADAADGDVADAFDTARENIERLREAFELEGITTSDKVRIHVAIAQVFLDLNRPDLALDELDLALALSGLSDLDLATIRSVRAQIFKAAGQLELMRLEYLEVVALAPNEPNFLLEAANGFALHGYRGDAVKTYDAAICLRPSDPAMYLPKVVYHLQHDETGPAARTLAYITGKEFVPMGILDQGVDKPLEDFLAVHPIANCTDLELSNGFDLGYDRSYQQVIQWVEETTAIDSFSIDSSSIEAFVLWGWLENILDDRNAVNARIRDACQLEPVTATQIIRSYSAVLLNPYTDTYTCP